MGRNSVNKKIYATTIIKHIEEKLKEFNKNPHTIEVDIAENDIYGVDSRNSDKIEGGYIQLNNGKFLNILKEDDQILQHVSIGRNNVYFAFHNLIWPKLKMHEKVITLLWLNDFLSSEYNSKRLLIAFNTESSELVEYTNSLNNRDELVINPTKLFDSTLGTDIMQSVMLSYLHYNIKSDFYRVLNGQKTHIFSKYVLADFMNLGVEELDNIDPYIEEDYENIDNELAQEIIADYFQPIKLEYRKIFEKMKEYMEVVNKSVEVNDDLWEEIKEPNEFYYEKLDQLFEKYYPNKTIEDYYEERYKKELKELDLLVNKGKKPANLEK